MPSVTLGRKRPSDAIVQGGTKPKKIKFTDDGAALAVTSEISASASKVKPDYSKVADKSGKYKKSREEPADTASPTLNVTRPSILAVEEIDFPRGGGTSLTALELKEARIEGVKDAESQIFKESNESTATTSPRKRLRNGKPKLDGTSRKSKSGKDKDVPRIEYLTYKKLVPGTRILAQVITTTALSVIVSLPHQLVGHIPVDKVSSELNNAMEQLMDRDEKSDDEDSGDEEDEREAHIPGLDEIFRPGQYLRAIVTAVHPHGVTLPTPTSVDGESGAVALGKPKNELDKASRRVELSIMPQHVNKGITGKDLVKGITLPASIVSIEDHGYTLDFGIQNVSGFLSFKDAKKLEDLKGKLKIGMLVDAIVKKMEENARMCTVSVGEEFAGSEVKVLTSTTAVQPGNLVRALVTGASSSGINVQVLGLFDGTIHPLHSGSDPSKVQIGKKIKARILWDLPGEEPRQFALSTLEHIIKLGPRVLSSTEDDGTEGAMPVEETYPVGTILENVKVSRVDEDRGLFLEVQPDLEAVVHISEVSDEHVPTLSASSGPHKINSRHRARVTGYCQLDGVLQCSMKESVLAQKWLRVSDVNVGELVKGTIMNLTDRGLFVSISGSVHAVVWPNHYADIRLKHPERKFKIGNSIKCRVLLVDPEKNRISLTAKKSLLESTLPIVSDISTVQVGALAHATVYKISERVLSIEFYNGVRGIVPSREATDTSAPTLEGLFSIGQVVKVRIIEIKPDGALLVGSILKAASTSTDIVPTTADLGKIEVGNSVSGTVSEIHKDNIVLGLRPTGVRALLSLNNLANHREISVSQLRASLKSGDLLDDLVVVNKNVNKALVIVAVKPKTKGKLPATDASVKIEDLQVGQKLPGLVVKHTRKGATVKLGKHVFGTLHPTDATDNYSTNTACPPVDSVVQTLILGIELANRQVALSTRPSRISGGSKADVIDPEIDSLDNLKVGVTVRGFVKTVADSGLFISLSRSVDARVQIKELFDEFVKEWKPRFEVNQVVEGRILSINKDSNQVEMTFRSGDLKRAAATKSLTDFSKGQKVDGTIRRVEDYGVFVQIKDTQISGLCHKSELADSSGSSASEVLKTLKEGDKVRALILSIDREKKRISFGLKPSYFFEEDLQDGDAKEEDGDEDGETNSDNDSAEDLQMIENDAEDSDSDEEMSFQPEKISALKNVPEEVGDSVAVTTLELSAPLRWNVDVSAEVEESSDAETSNDDEDAPARKKRKRKHEIQHDLTTDLQNRTPQSSADFERLLLGSPNSSYLWVQFMAFQLQLSEVEKAREVGRRALRAINFREEQERLNVWIALLNLEVTYGTEASLDAVFKEAARANDSKTIHWRLAILLDDSQKHEQAEDQFRKTCKKFSGSSKVWTLFAEHYFRRSMPDEARQLLQRSLLSLEKRKHLKTISKFAQLEFRMGDPERGRTIFEGIIETHRKRLDLWNIYIDMEAGQNDIQRIRGICERAVALKLSKKKAKFFFKKWLELEKKLGDEEGVDLVKQKAVEWTQNAAKTEVMTSA